MGGLSLTVYLLRTLKLTKAKIRLRFAKHRTPRLITAGILNGTELGFHVGYHEGDFAEALTVWGYADYGISSLKMV